MPGISKWPHLAQAKALSASAIIGLNSLPTTQYGHRTTRSVIAATPLAVGARNKTVQKSATPRSHPRTTRVARDVQNDTQSIRQQRLKQRAHAQHRTRLDRHVLRQVP